MSKRAVITLSGLILLAATIALSDKVGLAAGHGCDCRLRAGRALPEHARADSSDDLHAVPLRRREGRVEQKDWGTLVVRTAGADALALVPMLRRAIPQARSEFRVSNIHTQEELVRRHTIRERMLAMLSLFFAVVALLLAAVGLYGVLDYSVVQRRREIGIRLALGAQADQIVRRVAPEVFSMLLLGAIVGLGLGIASERYVETLLYEVKTTDLTMMALPVLTILTASLLAALPPVIRAVRIDPAAMLRAD